MNTPTYIDSIFLGKQLLKSFIRTSLKEGMTEEQIIKAFTPKKLQELTDAFCEDNNFTINEKYK